MTVADLFQRLAASASGKPVRVQLDDGVYDIDAFAVDDAEELVLSTGRQVYGSDDDDEDEDE